MPKLNNQLPVFIRHVQPSIAIESSQQKIAKMKKPFMGLYRPRKTPLTESLYN
jgi:hypothetical protein